MLGYKDPEEVAELLKDTTIFVLPTLMDNSPNSLAEAMAVGVPCVASNVGGIPSMIEDNKTGCLFNLNDADDLADKMIMLLKNIKLQEHLHIASSDIAFERNTRKSVCDAAINIYNKIIHV